MKSRLLQIAVALLTGVIFFTLFSIWLTQGQAALLACIALLVILWTTEALPLGVVSLLPIVLFPALGILTTKATTVNYAHPIIFLFLGGFLLAIAVEKTGLHRWIAARVLRVFPATVQGVIFGLALTSGLLSSILSNTTTTLLMISIALFISDSASIKQRLVLAVAYGASIGGIITPIGTPPNLILMGIMVDSGMPAIPFINWVGMMLPVAVVMFLVVGFVLSKGLAEERIETPLQVPRLDGNQRKVLSLLAGLMLLLFINAPIQPWYTGLGMSEPVILLSAGLILFLPFIDILDWDKDKAKIPIQIIFLFGAGFSIARGFAETGLAQLIADQLHVLQAYPLIVVLLLIALVVTFLTEITSNTALASVMLPVLYAVALQTGMDPQLLMLVATICASYAFMLPIATPPNAIAMSSGVVQVRQMMRYGLLFNLCGIALVVLMARFYW
ncbi:MAG: SLC13/DASS family transporter [Gammaproteobacteria bacterium]|nr:SLC13/DASS family transporter [Gammaproteobacteria bacterium]